MDRRPEFREVPETPESRNEADRKRIGREIKMAYVENMEIAPGVLASQRIPVYLRRNLPPPKRE
jgi:hypothetical protein